MKTNEKYRAPSPHSEGLFSGIDHYPDGRSETRMFLEGLFYSVVFVVSTPLAAWGALNLAGMVPIVGMPLWPFLALGHLPENFEDFFTSMAKSSLFSFLSAPALLSFLRAQSIREAQRRAFNAREEERK